MAPGQPPPRPADLLPAWQNAAMQQLRIATRRSPLALWQANHVAAALRTAHPGLEVVLVPVVTQGDRILDRPLAEVGGKGLFIKELEVAITAGQADLAVHSMKDVPAVLPDGFVIAAALERADPRDAFVSRKHATFAALPAGARVGTSSPRRQSILKSLRPDLEIAQLRGNVDTRLGRLEGGDLEAIVLAAAGLTRLGLAARITEYLDPGVSLPAIGQGVVGIECLGEPTILRLVGVLEHAPTRTCLSAERAFAERLEGSCQSPIAGFATLAGAELTLRGLVGAPDGTRMFKDSIVGKSADAAGLGRALADRLLAAGAGKMLASLRDAGA
jgi:hydroxymethylbilane synthase